MTYYRIYHKVFRNKLLMTKESRIEPERFVMKIYLEFLTFQRMYFHRSQTCEVFGILR